VTTEHDQNRAWSLLREAGRREFGKKDKDRFFVPTTNYCVIRKAIERAGQDAVRLFGEIGGAKKFYADAVGRADSIDSEDADGMARHHRFGFRTGRNRDAGGNVGRSHSICSAICEYEWLSNGRKYYRIWPTISSSLCRRNILDVPLSHMKNLGSFVFGLSFRDGDRVIVDEEGEQARFAFVSLDFMSSIAAITVAFSPHDDAHIGDSAWSLIDLSCGDDRRLMSTASKAWDFHISEARRQCPDSELEKFMLSQDAVRRTLCVGLSMAVLLTTDDEGLVQAKQLEEAVYLPRRGKKILVSPPKFSEVVFNVGSELNVSPHWRRGCPLALYWTGKGRKIPKYRPRKGCIVHRKTLVEPVVASK